MFEDVGFCRVELHTPTVHTEKMDLRKYGANHFPQELSQQTDA